MEERKRIPRVSLPSAVLPNKGMVLGRTFFKVAGGSIFYCVSAMFIIYGVSRILVV